MVKTLLQCGKGPLIYLPPPTLFYFCVSDFQFLMGTVCSNVYH